MPLTLKKVTKSFCKEYIKTDLDHRKINMIVDKIGEPNFAKYLKKDRSNNIENCLDPASLKIFK